MENLKFFKSVMSAPWSNTKIKPKYYNEIVKPVNGLA